MSHEPRPPAAESQLGKVPEPNVGELKRIITAGQRAIHTATDEWERRRPRDIRGMRAITKPSNYEVPQRVLWHGGLASVEATRASTRRPHRWTSQVSPLVRRWFRSDRAPSWDHLYRIDGRDPSGREGFR